MSVANVLAYRVLIRDNLVFMKDIKADKIQFFLTYDHDDWTLEAYCIVSDTAKRVTLLESCGDSPEEAYENMLDEAAVRIDEGDC